MNEDEWKQLVLDVMARYAAAHPGERYTIEEWAELLRDEVCQEDMKRWYVENPQYRPYNPWLEAAATDEKHL